MTIDKMSELLKSKLTFYELEELERIIDYYPSLLMEKIHDYCIESKTKSLPGGAGSTEQTSEE